MARNILFVVQTPRLPRCADRRSWLEPAASISENGNVGLVVRLATTSLSDPAGDLVGRDTPARLFELHVLCVEYNGEVPGVIQRQCDERMLKKYLAWRHRITQLLKFDVDESDIDQRRERTAILRAEEWK